MQYKRVNKSLNKGNILLPVNEEYYDKLFEFMEKDPEADYYESIYTYSDEHKKTFDETGSLAGIKNITTNKLVFDFDSKENPDLARKDAVELCSRLVFKGIASDSIQISYSGSKGYHVVLDTTESFTRKQCETIMKKLGEDLSTLDFKITDEQRILRLPLTKHPKTQLYKIPLTLNQLTELPLTEVQKLSKTILDDHYEILNTWNQIELPKSILEYKNIPEKTKEVKAEVLTDRPDFSSKPRHLTPAKFALQEGFYESGERHEALMILASTYRGLGYNDEIAYNMLKATNRLQARRTDQEPFDNNEIWLNIISYTYGPKWKGGTYSENQNALMQKIIKKFNLSKEEENPVPLVNLNKVTDVFKNFAENIDKNTIKLGINSIDEKIRITTSTLTCLLAAPSVGKSSISFGILNNVSRNDSNAMFFSLDMGLPLVYQRLIQRHTGHMSDVIFENYKSRNIVEVAKYEKILEEEYQNVKFCFRSGITPDDIRNMVIHERDNGRLPRLLLVDYLECVRTEYSDPNASKALVAQKLKDLANEFDIAVWLLVQPPKSAGSPDQELNSYRQIKGSSVIEEAASVILTMHRPGWNPKKPDTDKYVTITCVKNRMGELGTFDFRWKGLTGEIWEMEDEDVLELKEIREKKKAAEMATKDLY